MALFFGLQSMQAYVAFGWLPQIFRDAGAPLDRASLLLAAFSVWGVPGGFIIPPLVTRSRHLQTWVIFFVSMLVVGYTGLLVAPLTVAWLWPCALASAGPFVVGWVHGLTGGWRVPLALLIASALPMAWAGWRACADGVIDDEVEDAAEAAAHR